MTDALHSNATSALDTPAAATMRGARASLSDGPVQLLGSSTTVGNGVARIDLEFSADMAKGAGFVYVTNGAVQTVIDRVTQQPVIRIVDATETLKIAVADLQVSGKHVIIQAAGLDAGQHYSVYMGEGALLSATLRPFAGVTVPGAIGFAMTDSSAPAVTAMELSSTVLASGPGMDLTIRFSEAVATLPSSALQAPGASIANLRKIGDGSVWMATLSTTNTAASIGNKVSLDMSQVRDAAGNAGSGSALSPAYAIDDARLPTATIELPDTSLVQGEQVEAVIRFSEPVTTLPAAALQAPGVSIGSLQQVGDGSVWKVVLTATSNLASTGNQLSLDMSQVRDAAGHAGSGSALSPAYVIDDARLPTASIVLADDMLAAGEQGVVTITFSEPVSGLTLGAITAPHATLSDLASTDGGRTWTMKMAPAASNVHASGNTISINLGAVTDTAGHAGAGAAVSAAYTVDTRVADTSAPTLESLTLDDYSLDATHDIVATIRFSEAVQEAGLLAALDAEGATLTDLATSDSGRTWTVKLNADPSNTTPGMGKLDLNMHAVRDLAGNAGAGSESMPFAVNIGSPWMAVGGDYEDDDLIGNVQHYINGYFLGDYPEDPSASFELSIGGIVIGNSDITLVRVDGLLFWSYSSEAYWTTGAYDIVAQATASDNTVQRTSKHLVVDSDGPVVVESPGAGASPPPFNVADAITIVFDEAVTFSGSDPQIEVDLTVAGVTSTVYIHVDADDLSADRKTLTIAADKHLLPGGATAVLSLPWMEDLLGNQLPAGPIRFTTTGSFADTVAPTVQRVVVDGGLEHAGIGDVIEFQVRFSETIRKLDDSYPALVLNNGARASFHSITDNTALFKYTVRAGDDVASLAIASSAELIEHLGDLAGNAVASAHIEFGGLFVGDGYGGYEATTIAVDATAPAALAAPQLAPESDSGDSADDLVTNVSTPILFGSGAEANAEIELYRGDSLIGYGLADGYGSWSATVSDDHALADGAHSLTVRQVDLAGNRSAASPALAVTIDTGTPATLTAPDLENGYDSGISDSDNITRENQPTLSGSGAEAGALVKIFAGDHELASTRAAADGSWSVGFWEPLVEGEYVLSAVQFDAAGNMSAISPSLSFTVDRTGPAAAPPAPRLDALSDTGISDSDGITTDTTPTFTGSGALASSEIALYANEREVGRTVTDALGNWTITLDTALTDGDYSIGLKQFDIAGNDSGYSPSFDLEIDTTAPVSLAKTVVERTYSLSFTEQIVFAPGGHVAMYQESSLLAQFIATGGNWNIIDTAMSFQMSAYSGVFKMQASTGAIQDLAGNVAIIGTAHQDFTLPGLST